MPYALETLEAIAPRARRRTWATTPPGKVRVEVVNNARELSKVSTLTESRSSTTGTIAICKFNKLMVTSPKAVAQRLRLAGHAGARVRAPGGQPDEPQHGAHLAARGPGQVPRVALARQGRAWR